MTEHHDRADPTHYADASALVKLVLAEAESAALRTWIRSSPRMIVTCDLTWTELMQAVTRFAPDRAKRARDMLSGLSILSLTAPDFEAAGRLTPPAIRALDALHLNAALMIGDQLDSMLTYDDRMAAAARSHGLRVDAPGPS